MSMSSPMPPEATWTDFVNAHGGPQTPGWWVTLCWYADSEHPRPEVVGPYPSYDQAVSAMEDSLLIDGFAEDTKREDWLDDAYVATDSASIAQMCANYGSRVTLIDPFDPDHFGSEHPGPAGGRATTQTPATALQAGALRIAYAPPSRPATEPPAIGNNPGPAVTP
ncbi:hypothetical protein [Nocardioides sp. AN3]